MLVLSVIKIILSVKLTWLKLKEKIVVSDINLARLYRQTFCYSKFEEMLKLSIRLVINYLKYGSVALQTRSSRKLEAMATPAAGIA
jgi:hypothetical protein